MKHMGAPIEDTVNPPPSDSTSKIQASKSVNNPKGERIERGTSSKKGEEGEIKMLKVMGAIRMEKKSNRSWSK